MGLSTKQVSNPGLGWSRSLLEAQSLELPKPSPMRRQALQNQSQQPPEKCPRCDSMNTKFCYYNNYNKSQPRYFCKTCKRHWTKGGTLRNVPIGGGRKNKRLKTSNSSAVKAIGAPAVATAAANASAATTNTALGSVRNSGNMVIQPQQCQLFPQTSEILFQSLVQQDLDKGLSTSSGIFLNSSTSPLAQNQHPFFSFSSSSGSFEGNPSSISTTIQSSNPSFFAEEAKIMEDLTVSTFMPTTVPPILSSNGIDMTSCWNLEDIDKFVSWDESEIKP